MTLVRIAILGTGLFGCIQTPPTEPPDVEEVAPPLRIADLWAGAIDQGNIATVENVVVISGRTADASHFYAQDAGGGPQSGLRLALSDPMPFWPPEIGAVVTLKGPVWLYDGAPTLFLEKVSNALWTGERVEPTASPWDGDPALTHSLVEGSGSIVSAADPSGRAQLDDGTWLQGDFGLGAPDYGASGDYLGVAAPDRGLLLRRTEDWSGSWEPTEPEVVSLTDLRGGLYPDGAKVRITGVLVATEWSLDGRWSLAQDLAGEGVWLDSEGFGTPVAKPGDVGDITGELRSDGVGLRLRVWDPPTMRQSGTAFRSDELRDGQLGQWRFEGIGPADPSGDRRTVDGVLLDNRYADLGDLPDPVLVEGAVQVAEDGTLRVAVQSWTPADP